MIQYLVTNQQQTIRAGDNTSLAERKLDEAQEARMA